jgi:ABC-type glutathione transport system ATPase component
MSTASADALRSPRDCRRQADRLLERRDALARRSMGLAREFAALSAYLDVAPRVTAALEHLSDQLFQQLLTVVQEKLTIALQEVLEQPIQFRAEANFRNKAAAVDFWIERDGNEEDILRGQGGSVANILSVGLRMFALATLDQAQHRPLLVLDEPDCWLRPELVPRLVKIIHDAAMALGFQVLLISHHDVATFERYADRVLQVVSNGARGVEVREVAESPSERDP